MHGIMAGIFHRLTCATQCSRSINNLSPRREGEALASVTKQAPTDGAYWEYDSFGVPTGRVVILFEGEEIPPSRHGFEWKPWQDGNI